MATSLAPRSAPFRRKGTPPCSIPTFPPREFADRDSSRWSSCGTVLAYSGGLTQVLAAVVEQTTGRGIFDYAREVLFGPLFVYDVVWRSEDGITPTAAYGLRLRARDLAKFGSTFLHGGVWNERRIVSQGWVDETLRSHVTNDQLGDLPAIADHVGYGYQWWVVRYALDPPGRTIEAPTALGNGNQRVILVPEQGLCVTIFAGEYNTTSDTIPWFPDRLVLEHVLPSIHSESDTTNRPR